MKKNLPQRCICQYFRGHVTCKLMDVEKRSTYMFLFVLNGCINIMCLKVVKIIMFHSLTRSIKILLYCIQMINMME